ASSSGEAQLADSGCRSLDVVLGPGRFPSLSISARFAVPGEDATQEDRL
ncbi:MAG: hypothetical protein AVDCRST_MAG37-3599, partial [uncultured Rubrobacteraceae bacterium]